MSIQSLAGQMVSVVVDTYTKYQEERERYEAEQLRMNRIAFAILIPTAIVGYYTLKQFYPNNSQLF